MKKLITFKSKKELKMAFRVSFYILFIVITNIQAKSQTDTANIYYTGFMACGGCSICGGDYWCINTIPSFCGNTPACDTKTFFDPIPTGKVITNVTINYWSAECTGSLISGSINGLSLPIINDGSTGCLCTGSPCGVVSTSSNYSCGMPNYVYGGTNTLQVCTGTSVCLYKVEIIFTYVNPLNTASITSFTNPSICGASDGSATTQGGATSYLWNTVPAQNTETATGLAAGVYTVTLTNGTCLSYTSVTITDPGAPVVTLSSNNSTICDGSSVIFTAGGATDYEFFVNGVSQGLPSSVSIFTTSSLLDGDIVHVNGSTAGCTGISSSVTTVVNDLPNVNAGVDKTICSGNNVTLSGSGATSYTWDNGVTNGTPFTPLSTITYTVTGTDVNGCSNTDQVIVTVNDLPTATIAPDSQSVCAGTSVILTATGGGTYLWNTTENMSAITVTPAATTTYAVTVTNSAGCTATTTSTITVNSIPPTPVITQNGNDLVSSATIGNQWYDLNGIITGATNFVYTPTQNGYYYVIITVNGCSSASSNIIYVNVSGIDEQSLINSNISIYPNPNAGLFSLTFTALSGSEAEIKVLNVLGETAYSEKISISRNEYYKEINLRKISTGSYFVQVKVGEKQIYKKLLIK